MQNNPKIILLHGALGSQSSLKHVHNALKDHYDVFRFDFEGHGSSKLKERPFSIEHFAENLYDYIQENRFNKVNIFGYSMGGYVAIYLAHKFPQYFDCIYTLGTKFKWTPEYAEREQKKLNPGVIEEKLPKYAQYLQQMHKSDWKSIVNKTGEMMSSLGKDNLLTLEVLSSIKTPICVASGDQDNMVLPDETYEVFKFLENGYLDILPHTKHPIEKVDSILLASRISYFIEKVREETVVTV